VHVFSSDWQYKKKETHAGTNDQGHTNNIPGEKETCSQQMIRECMSCTKQWNTVLQRLRVETWSEKKLNLTELEQKL